MPNTGQTIELQPCVPGLFVEQTKIPINYSAAGTPAPACGIYTVGCVPYGGVTVYLGSIEGNPQLSCPLIAWSLWGRFGRSSSDLELINTGTLAKLTNLSQRGSIQTAVGRAYQGFELWLSHAGGGGLGTNPGLCSIVWSTLLPSASGVTLVDGNLV